MTTVIQISDFHIKLSMGDPEENTVFTGLVRAISQFQRDGSKIIIVYNGDVIDNTNIYAWAVLIFTVDIVLFSYYFIYKHTKKI